MLQNSFTVYPFTVEKFVELTLASIEQSADAIHAPQIDYIGKYCDVLGAKTIVLEHHYVDRHYIDEFAAFYSRMLQPPRNSVKRVHFFKDEFDQDQLGQWQERSLRTVAERDVVDSEIKGYLGFCVIRPIASAPIGRTVLSQFPNKAGELREIWATTSHTAHLGNLKLKVVGLPFQQQDVGVGACATAALWSALTRVARIDGMRAPTPAEISDAAIHTAKRAVPMPASRGLTMAQLCQATRTLGFNPEVFSAHERPELFVCALHTYLLSGFPVVLSLSGATGGHALTAVGFSTSATENSNFEASVPVRSMRMHKIYVHDDQVGPYARAFIEKQWVTSPDPTFSDMEALVFQIDKDEFVVDSALVPLYPKIRLSVGSLLELALQLNAAVEKLLEPETAFNLRIDFRYERAGDYLRNLSGRLSRPDRGKDLAQKIVLSRWCAIARYYVGETEVMEFVFDTTDVVRSSLPDPSDLLRAVVSLNRAYDNAVDSLGNVFNSPFA